MKAKDSDTQKKNGAWVATFTTAINNVDSRLTDEAKEMHKKIQEEAALALTKALGPILHELNKLRLEYHSVKASFQLHKDDILNENALLERITGEY